MPTTKSKTRCKPPGPTPAVKRRNFTMTPADSARIDELARLIDPDSPEPNASLAVRIAVRNELERMSRGRR